MAAFATVVVAAVALLNRSDPPSTNSAGVTNVATSTTNPSGTGSGAPTRPPTTVAALVIVDPAWPQKGVSRYAESEESKRLRDTLGPLVPSTLRATTTTRGGTTTAKGTTTLRQRSPSAPPSAQPSVTVPANTQPPTTEPLPPAVPEIIPPAPAPQAQ